MSLAACPHYCTDPDVTWRDVRGYLLVVHYWADLQSVHGNRCYDFIARTRNISECLYSLYAFLFLVLFITFSVFFGSMRYIELVKVSFSAYVRHTV